MVAQGKRLYQPQFNPISLGGLALWLAADQGTFQNSTLATPATADGDPVGGWADLSGSNNNVTQGTTSLKPTLKLAIKNNRPVVRFDGVDDFLTRSSIAASLNYTLFTVVQLSSVVASSVFSNGTNGVNGFVTRAFTNRQINYPGAATASDDAATTNWELWSAVKSSSPNSTTLWVNGSVTSLNANVTAPVAASGNTVVGAAANGTVGMTGDIAEVLYYGNPLTTAQRQQIESYLNAKWAIY